MNLKSRKRKDWRNGRKRKRRDLCFCKRKKNRKCKRRINEIEEIKKEEFKREYWNR